MHITHKRRRGSLEWCEHCRTARLFYWKECGALHYECGECGTQYEGAPVRCSEPRPRENA
jgi:hypothetical protein